MSEGRSNQPPPPPDLGQQVAISSSREWKGAKGELQEREVGRKPFLFRTLVEQQPASNNRAAATATIAPRERRLEIG
jgi:hypothetical protein